MECDISIPFESQSGPHPFLQEPRGSRKEGAAQEVSWVASPRAVRREKSPGAKSTGDSRHLGLAAKEEERFLLRDNFLRGWQCFGNKEMYERKKTHHFSLNHQPRVRMKGIKPALTQATPGQPGWERRRPELSATPAP